MKKLLWIFALLTIFSNYTQAFSLVGVDWIKGSGDQKLTFDTRTRLEWLDLTETTGRSISSILAGHGDWVNNGFRYATGTEVYSLLESAGVAENMDRYGAVSGGTVAESNNLFSLENLIGTTYKNNPDQYTVYGWFLDNPGNIRGSYSYLSTIPGQQYQTRVYYSGGLLNTSDSLIGSFLVREVAEATAVTEPATIWLIGSALGGFSMIRRRRMSVKPS